MDFDLRQRKEPFLELIPGGGQPGPGCFLIGTGPFQSCCHTYNPGYIFSTSPFSPFLSAPLNQAFQFVTPFGKKHTYALGSMELVGGKGQQGGTAGLDRKGQMPHQLDGIRMERDPRLLAQPANCLNGLQGAGFIVGRHHGDQAGIRPQGFLHRLRGHLTVGIYRQQGYRKAIFLQDL